MKFKKSYILLIVMATFLLISIGSACANENITNDGDIELGDDGESVVLSDNSDTVENVADDTNQDKLGDTSQEKTNTTVETEKDTYKFGHDTDKNISVEVKANNSHINVNKNDLTILEGNSTINFEYNNTMISIKDTMAVGNHTLTISYLGNDTYANSSKIITVQVFGNNTIETETSVVCNGKNIEIPVKVHDGVEYVELIESIKSNFQLTLIYTNESGNISNLTIKSFTVEDGKIKFTAEPTQLIAASLIIDYANATEPKTVGIKVSTEVKAEKDGYEFKSEEIKNISITIYDGQGNLINVTKNDLDVFENGTSISNFTYNNSVVTFDLGVGVHNITIAYKGDETFNSSNTTVRVKVTGNYTLQTNETVCSNGAVVEIPVKVYDGAEYIPVTKDNFTLTLNYINETGNATSINVTDFTVENGTISFNNDIKWLAANITLNYTDAAIVKTVIIKLNSAVVASDAKIRDSEAKNISVKVLNNKDVELNVTKADLKVLENGREIAFDYSNSTITVKSLAIGNHTLTIVYAGNDTYAKSNKTILVGVWGNETINPDKSANIDENQNVNITVNLNDGVDLKDIDGDKLNLTLFYTVGNETFNKTINKDDVTINGQNIIFKVNETFDSANVLINYTSAENNSLTASVIIKVNSTINSDDNIAGKDNEVINFTVEVTGSNGKVLNVTADNIKVYNGSKALNITYNNSVITIHDQFKFGVYNLTIKFTGNSTYSDAEKTISLSIYGINATSAINVNSTKTGEVKINITDGKDSLPINKTDLNLTVVYKDGNDTKTINITDYEIVNGTLIFTLENGNFTTATLTINNNGAKPVNVTLTRIYNLKINPLNVTFDYQEGNFTFELIDADTGEKLANRQVSISGTTSSGTQLYWDIKSSGSSISINTQKSVTSDANGIITVENLNFYPGLIFTSNNIYAPSGDYNLTIAGSGNVKGSQKVNIKINPITLKLEIIKFDEYFGTSKKFTILVTNANSGNPISGVTVNFKVVNSKGEEVSYTVTSDGKPVKINSTSTNNDGKIELPASNLLPDTYTISGDVVNTSNYNKTNGQGTATIKKIPVKINGNNVKVEYNSGKSYTVKVTKNGKGVSGVYILVELYVTSKKVERYVFQTNKNGQIPISADLAVGKHKIIVSMADSRYSASKITKTITVNKAKAKFKAPKVNTYYKSDKPFTVKLINSKTKTGIYAAKIKLKVIGGKPITIKTGMDGKVRLSLNNLNPGTYKIKVYNGDTKNYNAKAVTTKIVIKKTPTKLTPKKLTAKKGAKKYFKVTAKNKKTKKVIKGLKLKVKVIGKKSKTYKIKTNSKGVAKLSTAKLKVGKYKVVVTSADKYCVAKKAKSTIKIKK